MNNESDLGASSKAHLPVDHGAILRDADGALA